MFGASRSLVFRARPSIGPRQARNLPVISRRGFAEEKETNPTGSGIGHVSEEAIDTGKIMGETTPDMSQGTPVQDVS